MILTSDEAQKAGTSNDYFPALTGVRAIAAYLVFMHHYFKEQFIGKSFFTGFGSELHVGVTFFFVLSGFLIAYRYLDLKAFNFRNYMVNRIARIFPVYFILTTLTFLIPALTQELNLSQHITRYLISVSFLRGFFDELKFSGIMQGWSLTVEELFYLMAPLFFLLIKRSKSFLIILPAAIVSIGIILVLIFRNVNTFGLGFFNSFEFMFNYTFFGRCSEFFIGIALAIVYKQYRPAISFRHFTYTGLILIVINIFLLSLLKGNADIGVRHPLGKVINTLILPLTGIALFYYGLLTERTVISKILGSNLFVLLGKSSYVFYLIHMGIIEHLLFQVTSNVMVLFICFNLVSVAIFKWIEDPLNHLIRKKFSRKPTAVSLMQETAVIQ